MSFEKVNFKKVDFDDIYNIFDLCYKLNGNEDDNMDYFFKLYDNLNLDSKMKYRNNKTYMKNIMSKGFHDINKAVLCYDLVCNNTVNYGDCHGETLQPYLYGQTFTCVHCNNMICLPCYLGNYSRNSCPYCDTLFRAGLDLARPFRCVTTTFLKEIRTLHNNIHK